MLRAYQNHLEVLRVYQNHLEVLQVFWSIDLIVNSPYLSLEFTFCTFSMSRGSMIWRNALRYCTVRLYIPKGLRNRPHVISPPRLGQGGPPVFSMHHEKTGSGLGTRRPADEANEVLVCIWLIICKNIDFGRASGNGWNGKLERKSGTESWNGKRKRKQEMVVTTSTRSLMNTSSNPRGTLHDWHFNCLKLNIMILVTCMAIFGDTPVCVLHIKAFDLSQTRSVLSEPCLREPLPPCLSLTQN